jgi:hypothetical protein
MRLMQGILGQTVKDGETASVVLWIRVQPEEGLGLEKP